MGHSAYFAFRFRPEMIEVALLFEILRIESHHPGPLVVAKIRPPLRWEPRCTTPPPIHNVRFVLSAVSPARGCALET